jgi:hypothetical protein
MGTLFLASDGLFRDRAKNRHWRADNVTFAQLIGGQKQT